ncbi:MAG: SpoIVB peptidase, partial [Clostridiales bacterium]|nr:SpoIVB peptidase [Clostridiales bacterium]
MMNSARARYAGRFLLICAVILIVSFLIYIFSAAAQFGLTSYPYKDIFQEEAITASRGDGDLLVPVGITAGIRFNTRGIMILGLGEVRAPDGQVFTPGDGKLQSGDIVMAVDGRAVATIAEMVDAIGAGHAGRGCITMEILRDEKSHNVEISPVKCCDSGIAKIGCWVRDSTRGIGTITYYCPNTKSFAALGHGILDVDTKKLLTVSHGQVLESKIIEIRKGKKGAPGEIIGEINENSVIGEITKNTPLGIYGIINMTYAGLPSATFATAAHGEISRGPARILSNIEGGGIKSYDIFIESINQDNMADKAMVIRITDQGLISRTNGIVQGMSGSPIIQNNRLIGAITHVFVQNPLRGYGVAVEK